MKKSILIVITMLLVMDLTAQVNQLITRRDTVIFKSDIEKVQYCLGEYYRERETGLIMSMTGAAVAVVSSLAIVNSPDARKAGIIIGAAVGVIGIGITIDADKWIRRASIGISPTKLTFNF